MAKEKMTFIRKNGRVIPVKKKQGGNDKKRNVERKKTSSKVKSMRKKDKGTSFASKFGYAFVGGAIGALFLGSSGAAIGTVAGLAYNESNKKQMPKFTKEMDKRGEAYNRKAAKSGKKLPYKLQNHMKKEGSSV